MKIKSSFTTQVIPFFTQKKVLVVASVLVLLVVLAVLYLGQFMSNTQRIYFTEDGFKPNEITIQKGSVVIFKNKSDDAFWPASNVHPTHSAYPDFDPKKPIASGGSWSFTFTESGIYRFHDHINSNFEGVITVTDTKGSVAKLNCSEEKNVQCWESLILNTLKVDGIEAAFQVLINLSETEPLFTKDCHGYAHLIGEEAYNLYVANENFELTPATALCGYGFYHGFMETMLLTTGDIQEARDFCEMADQKLAGQASAAATACYHGTGHGAVDGSDPTAWGDVEAMMEPGFTLCTALAQTDLQLYLCNTGVFNATEVISHDPKYKIEYIHEDPFAVCNAQSLDRREACYSNMIPLLITKFSNDVDAMLEYTNERMIDNEKPAIDGHTINELVTIGIMFEFMRLYGTDPDYAQNGIELCRRQNEDDHLACVEGLSGGHIKYGPPGKGYIKNIEFCKLELLTEEERDSCYKYLLSRLSSNYSLEKTQEICQMIDVQYAKRYCMY